MLNNWKPSRTVRKKQTHTTRAEKVAQERAEKAAVRRRDKRCRFPLCGCRSLGLRLEVSHDFHKGMGSKDGVSIASLMVLLCEHRHQHGTVSRHRGTMRSVYLTPDGYDGPVAWEIDINALLKGGALPAAWMEVARETAPGQLDALSPWQAASLAKLATMED